MSTTINDLELARMQVVALFVHDEDGRLLGVNESDPAEPAPRFFLARTAEGNLWRTRYDLPAGLVAALEQSAAGEPVVSDLSQPARCEAECTALLEQHTPLSSTYAGPAYYLPDLSPTAGAESVIITPANTALLERYYPFARSAYDELAPVIVRVEDGVAVSICFSARIPGRLPKRGYTRPSVTVGVAMQPVWCAVGQLLSAPWDAFRSTVQSGGTRPRRQ